MKRVTLLVALAAMLAVPIVSAQPDGPRFGRRGMGMHHDGMRMHDRGDRAGIERIMFLADELGLTDEQRDRLEQMRSDHRMRAIDQRAAIEKAQLRLRDMMQDHAPAAEVGRAIDDVSKLRAEMEKANYAHRLDMRNVLTPEQQKKLDELRDRRWERRRDRLNDDDDRPRGPRQG